MKKPASRAIVALLVCLTPLGCDRRSVRAPTPTHVQIDEVLVLMQQRLQLMHEVARWKWNAHGQISDPDREQELLERLAAAGSPHGLDADFTRDFFRAQIEAAKAIQQDDFATWKKAKQGPFEQVPDLGRELRPRIDELGTKLLTALPPLQHCRGDRDCQRLLKERANLLLAGPGITAEVRELALAPLLDPPEQREP